MTNDPVSDMLTRVRNAIRNRHAHVSMPYARLKMDLAQVLKREGYIRDASEAGEGTRRALTITLKYGPLGEQVIQRIERASCPGRRLYRGVAALPKVLDGLGIAILSTPRGLLSDREAREQRVGGELLCKVW